MFASALIIFREVLEIALILCAILAATNGLPQRITWVMSGLGGGIIGAVLLAFGASAISSAVDGVGQELVNAGILFSAAILIGWTVVWMQTHGRELSQKIKQLGKQIGAGEVPFYTLTILIALTTLREGSEIVLFSYGLLASGTSVVSLAGGAALGLAAGSAIGILFYFGLLKIAAKRLFTVTGILLTLLAAGMASQSAGFLISAGYLPEFGTLWDSSHIVSQQSTFGTLLHILVGYTDRPLMLQLVAYALTIIIITLCMKLPRYLQAKATLA